ARRVGEGGKGGVGICGGDRGGGRRVSSDSRAGFGTNESAGPPVSGGPEPVCSSNPIPGVGIVVKRNPGSSNARIGPAGSGEEVGGGPEPQCSSNPIPAVGIVVKRNPGAPDARTGAGGATGGAGGANEAAGSSNPAPRVGTSV